MMNENRQRIGERLRRFRETAEMDQKPLATRAGLSQPTYSRLENGTAAITLGQAYLLAGALGIRPDALLGREDQEARVLCAARTNGETCDMAEMRRTLLDYHEVDAYLDDVGVPR